MNRFDDLLPEEIEPQHKELITILQRAYSRPVMVPPAEQAQIIARVQARLVQTDHGDSFNRNIPLPQIGVLDSFPHQAVSPAGKPRRDRRRFRLITLIAAAMLISMLLSAFLLLLVPRLSTTGGSSASSPAITLSTNVVYVTTGSQKVPVQIVNFEPGTHVLLTHDVQEMVTTTSGSSVVKIGSDGSANATIIVDSSWGPAFHQVYAEDIQTRYTASAQLQVITAAPSKPAHLLLEQNGKALTKLDFGAGIVGSDSIMPVQLTNSGDGSISWTASSNQPWLLLTPGQGTFSQSQSIEVAVQRTALKAGPAYGGTITFSSNVGPSEALAVTMSVSALPASGPVLALSPAVLSFSTTDGSATAPTPQPVTLNNAGTQALNWSLSVKYPATGSTQIGTTSPWLSASLSSGSIAPGASQPVTVSVNSSSLSSLLPGAYLGEVVVTSTGVDEGPQWVAVSLTIQPHCGVVTSSGSLAFTAVQGKTTPSNQALGLSATASCATAQQALAWKAVVSTPSWLSVTPGSGQLKGTTSEFLSVGVNGTGLPAGRYAGNIALTLSTSTQTVFVQLVVQPPPPAGAPIMSASPLNLNFSSTQGQQNPPGQVVTMTNNGGSTLNWSVTPIPFVPLAWLSASPTGGRIQPGQSGQMVVNVDTSQLSPGTYAGQITLSGTDSNNKPASGSGQVVSVNLVVQPPCTLTQPSSSSLAFSGVQGGSNPSPQTLLITVTGNCAWPLNLAAGAPSGSWLKISRVGGGNIEGSGQSASFTVNTTSTGLAAKTYNATFTISATDSAGNAAQSSPQTIAVTLTVQPACTAASVPHSLTFTAAQGSSSSSAQNVALSETGSCAFPVTWTASNSSSSSWLSLTPPAQDTGSGSSLGVNVNPSAANLAPGTYRGTITLSATDSNGVSVVGSNQVITVTLTVTP